MLTPMQSMRAPATMTVTMIAIKSVRVRVDVEPGLFVGSKVGLPRSDPVNELCVIVTGSVTAIETGLTDVTREGGTPLCWAIWVCKQVLKTRELWAGN